MTDGKENPIKGAKLTVYDVMYLRYKRYYGGVNMCTYAYNLRVHHTAIRDALYGINYKWLPVDREGVERWWLSYILNGKMPEERRKVKIGHSRG
jgi:predicted DNA-binding transcriptional regulator